jgi:RNase P/RNase MRP subunit p29
VSFKLVLNIFLCSLSIFISGITEQGTLMLQKADFHGALLKVVRSKCSSLVGVQGIILMDTKGTFQIICKDDKVRSELNFIKVFQYL